MGILTVILVATVVVLVYFLYDRGKQKMTSGNEDINTKKETIMKETENNGQENAQNTQDKQERNFHTKDFLLETLQKMNVNYEFSPDDETRLWLEWQGGHFAIDTANDNPFIEIWFLQWEDWELYDIDTISRVKRIINDVNIKTPITVVYSVNEAAKKVSEILSDNMRLISKKWDNAAVSMTGGCDSKTTLSCAKDEYDSFSYFSYVSSESEQVDADAAHKICEALGLSHKIYSISENDEDFKDLEDIRKILRWNSGDIRDNNHWSKI